MEFLDEEVQAALKAEIKAKAKKAINGAGQVYYPDLMVFLGQSILRETLDSVLRSMEKKGLIIRESDDMGTLIRSTKVKDE